MKSVSSIQVSSPRPAMRPHHPARRFPSAATWRAVLAGAEPLESRCLFTVALNSPVSVPLSATPTGDPAAPVLADFDGDGKLDVVVAYPSASAIESGFIQFGKGDGQGAFALGTAVDAGIFVGVPVTGDFNGDGNLDLAVCNAFQGQVKVLPGNGDGTFGTALTFTAGVSPEALASGDFNADGRSDLVVGNRSSNTATIYLGDASATLAEGLTLSTETDPATVAVGDFTNDGKVDVLVGASGGGSATNGTIQVFAGNGDGTFNTAPIATTGPRGVTAVADINADGAPDVIVGVSDRDEADALVNAGNGTFTLTPKSTGKSATKAAVAADLDLDGKPDLVTAVGGQIDVLGGIGDGTFAKALSFDAAGGSGPAVGDVNGDGRPDVLTVTATPGSTTGRFLNVSTGERVGPDLSVQFVQTLPATVKQLTKQKFVLRMTNNGNATLSKSPTLVQVYASTDGVVDSNDLLMDETTPRLTLKPGKSKVIPLKFLLDQASGTYNLIARVDPNGTTGDIDLSNNATVGATQTTIELSFVSLTGQLANVPAGPFKAGDKVSIDLLITNAGNLTAQGRSVNLISASTDSVIDSADLVLYSATNRVTIKPGATKTLHYKFKTPQGIPAGSYFLIGLFNTTASINESNFDDNSVIATTPTTFSS